MADAVLPKQKKGFLPDINITDPRYGYRLKRNRLTFRPKRKEAESNSSCQESMESKVNTITEEFSKLFRYPLHQSICVSMLQEGFPYSFEELFSLLRHSKVLQEAADPDSTLFHLPPLEEQPQKLKMLKEHLTAAEDAERSLFQEVEAYENYLALAKFFSTPEDTWLRHHFYELSFQAAHNVTSDYGRREAEANEHMAQVYLEKDQLQLAQNHYEEFHHLVQDKSWQDENGRLYRLCASESLCRIYTLIAEGHMQKRDYKAAVEFFNKGYNMSKDADDLKMKGDVAFKLGLAYQKLGIYISAKQFLNKYATIALSMGETDGVGKAYKEIARCLEGERKMKDSIQYLQKYAEISQKHNHVHNVLEAYMGLGFTYKAIGDYNSCCESFRKAYEIACDMGSAQLAQKAQVCLGIAKAHTMLPRFSSHVKSGGKESIKMLIHWKETKEDVFQEIPNEEQEKERAGLMNGGMYGY